jgi:hypothetical protein
MGAEAKAAPTPATACLNDLRAFSGKMQQEGYWLGGSAYGYGYPMGEYGYGYGYPMGNDRAGHEGGYHNTRPGYEVRNLMIAANILAQNGQQQACEWQRAKPGKSNRSPLLSPSRITQLLPG